MRNQTFKIFILRWIPTLLACSMSLFLFLLATHPVPIAAKAGDKQADQTQDATPDLLWKKPVVSCTSINIAPNSKYIGVISRDGDVVCFDSSGKITWRITLAGANQIAISTDGSAIAYSNLNPADSAVYLISTSGKVIKKTETFGAIWSSSASPEPGVFAVGSGEKYCYIFTISKNRYRFRRWKLPGAPCSTNYSPDGKTLLFGAWQDAGIASFKPNGSQIAKLAGKSERLYFADYSSDGKRIIAVSRPNRGTPEGFVGLFTEDLKEIWTEELPYFNISADMSPRGALIAVGYERTINHKNKEIRENRIALYNRDNKRLWEKGGLFAKWNLIGISPTDKILLYDDANTLYTLDESGKVAASHQLPASIRTFAKNQMRNRVAIYCGDGYIHYFSIN